MRRNWELAARIYVKLELFNPAGSVKDRVALSMIRDAEEKGLLAPGDDHQADEWKYRNRGLCFDCGRREDTVNFYHAGDYEYRKKKAAARIWSRDCFDGWQGRMDGAIRKAEELAREMENAMVLGQFVNPANPKAHYEQQTNGNLGRSVGSGEIPLWQEQNGGTVTERDAS